MFSLECQTEYNRHRFINYSVIGEMKKNLLPVFLASESPIDDTGNSSSNNIHNMYTSFSGNINKRASNVKQRNMLIETHMEASFVNIDVKYKHRTPMVRFMSTPLDVSPPWNVGNRNGIDEDLSEVRVHRKKMGTPRAGIKSVLKYMNKAEAHSRNEHQIHGFFDEILIGSFHRSDICAREISIQKLNETEIPANRKNNGFNNSVSDCDDTSSDSLEESEADNVSSLKWIGYDSSISADSDNSSLSPKSTRVVKARINALTLDSVVLGDTPYDDSLNDSKDSETDEGKRDMCTQTDEESDWLITEVVSRYAQMKSTILEYRLARIALRLYQPIHRCGVKVYLVSRNLSK